MQKVLDAAGADIPLEGMSAAKGRDALERGAAFDLIELAPPGREGQAKQSLGSAKPPLASRRAYGQQSRPEQQECSWLGNCRRAAGGSDEVAGNSE